MELNYDWCMWYQQQQQDGDLLQPLHGGLFSEQHLTDDPICQPLQPVENYPVIMPVVADDDSFYAELHDLSNFADDQLIDPIISPNSLQLCSHQQNYQILGVQYFNDFETWWNANLSILLYSDVDTNAAEPTMDTKPVLITSSNCSSTTAMLGNFNGSESFVTNDCDSTDHDQVVVGSGKRRHLERSFCRPKSSNLGYEVIQKYFHVPITKAAQELKVGVTVLKKRCRELAIARWPPRKLKSLNGLIDNVKELGGITNEEEIKMLEEHRRALEMVSGLQLTSRTKKLRQVCFKASYKKRRLIQMINTNSTHDHHHPSSLSVLGLTLQAIGLASTYYSLDLTR